MKLMILSVLLFLISPFVSNAMVEQEKKSLTYFESPFLLGDWYFFKPAHIENAFDVLHISLSSDHQFTIEMIELDKKTSDSWSGQFQLSPDRILFTGENEEAHVYHYQVSHNRLYLNGVEFLKVVPDAFIGTWRSQLVSGEDIMVSDVQNLNLFLGSDFIFSLEVISSTGKRNQKIGYYYFEDDDLVLLYDEGEQESTFEINEDALELKNEQFGMYALLVRD